MNKLELYQLCFGASGIFFNLLFSLPALAQIVPDTSLPNNSKIDSQENTSTITGGTQAGTNLFHSFEKFSVPTGSTARFNNVTDIQNILTRVTGGSISNIDGLIQANGTANLFLLNPNGIIFGSNARLNLGGSFIGSTASSIKFADGIEFSAVLPQSAPLLTVDVPIGLNFGSKSTGAIQVRGIGSQVTSNSMGKPLSRGDSLTGLRVQPRKTLALIGGGIDIEGGTTTAEGGRVELTSVGSGFVALSPDDSGWLLNNQGVSNFKDIRLSNRALVDASGIGNSSIQVSGANVMLADGSLLLIQNQGEQPSGSMKVNALDSLVLDGTSSHRNIASGLRTETLSSANGSDISIFTKNLTLQDGGQIGTIAYNTARAGNVDVKATNSVQILGISKINPNRNSGIASFTYSSGNAGNIQVLANQLKAADGGILSSSTLGRGNGGDITLNTNLVELSGRNSRSVSITSRAGTASGVASIAFNTGNAGSVTVNTARLKVIDGASISTSSIASGNAGTININASDSINVSSLSADSSVPSTISSSVTFPDEIVQQRLNVPKSLSGQAGDIIINTQTLNIDRGGLISVRNDGTGNAGIVRLNANSIDLDKGSITSATASKEGGDIFLNSRNLQLRDGSSISATAGLAGGGGNGGNIIIDTDTLAALNRSSITANAFTGRGGNIQINTQGLFRSTDSIFSASSQFGINGLVKIETTEFDFIETALPEQSPQNPQLAIVCQGQADVAAGELVDAGTEAAPTDPSNSLNSSSGWHDTNSYPQGSNEIAQLASSHPTPIVEAQGWKQNHNGTVSFTTETDDIVPYGSLSSPACIRTQSR
ncbi:filamentous hemagglutinin N-terminal domain-containing protein [Chroococcidiopsis sp. FACHB-1243]|uniref:two-partner secretion domain-containing protein n=1 Tax=Chroococcidiopsis sp. [FACHB-1243] TaxID=2692781 RepID=UPI001780BD4D|nr:filamentous hemagglutinin N-terminal domain-containing protein [Chroococcidiopsis sp. [FACHB-1243]]MBD2305588.1 filamentous hemagglutinin N-terminal domain-containing protein [Chroococcidiopsis sp. [FACHB-1243]]